MASVAPTPALSAGSGTAADRGVENLCAEALQRSAALRPPAYVCARTACRICALVSPAPAAWPPRSGGHRCRPCPDGAHLQLAISTGQGSDGVARANLKRLATQIANEYMRNHPRVLLHLRFLPEGDLVESVRSRARLGAGPDLLISRVAPVEILEREGYLKPIEISPQQLDPLQLKFLSKFCDGSSYDALPFLLQPMVACYDRRRLPRAPSRLDELPVRAAEGVRGGCPYRSPNCCGPPATSMRIGPCSISSVPGWSTWNGASSTGSAAAASPLTVSSANLGPTWGFPCFPLEPRAGLPAPWLASSW
jgi:hypothetical protein